MAVYDRGSETRKRRGAVSASHRLAAHRRGRAIASTFARKKNPLQTFKGIVMNKLSILTRTLLVLLMLSPWIIAQSAKPKPQDANTLRTKFVAAFGKDFDLVKDQMTTRAVERGGGTYWLAFVKPKRTGHFYLQYRYQESDPLYIREHEIRFGIGPEKCRRGAPYSGVYARFCLGDTLIVPVLVNNYPGHEFKLAKAEYANGKEDPPESTMDSAGLDNSSIENPAAPIPQGLFEFSFFCFKFLFFFFFFFFFFIFFFFFWSYYFILFAR
jgi:hypothetical protein